MICLSVYFQMRLPGEIDVSLFQCFAGHVFARMPVYLSNPVSGCLPVLTFVERYFCREIQLPV